MKIFLFTILSLFTPLLSPAQYQQIKEPIYLLNTLMSCASEEEMKDICSYYGFSENPNENGFYSYTHPDGTNFIFKMEGNGIYREGSPSVEIRPNKSKEEVKKILTDIGYTKQGSKYVRGSKHTLSHKECKFINNGGATKTSFICNIIKQSDI